MRIPLRGLAAAIVLAACASNAGAQTSADEGWPESERLMSRYKAGNCPEVIARAPGVLPTEPWNHDLRLSYANCLLWSGSEWRAVEQYRMLLDTEVGPDARLGLANGLAWSGRMSESLPHYKMLVNGPHAGEAKQGMANALRWMGRDDLALPIYRELRVTYPQETIGEEGLFYSRRAVRARTLLGNAYNHDNAPMSRNEPTLSHSWRMLDNSLLLGIEASGGRDWWNDAYGGSRYDRREFGFRVESLSAPLAPRLVVSRETEPEGPAIVQPPVGQPTLGPYGVQVRARTFGDLRLAVAEWPLYVNLGRVNWGKLSFTPGAQLNGLYADRVGIEGRYQVEAGEIRGFANHFKIKGDDVPGGLAYDPENTVNNGELSLVLRWRPLGREIRPYFGAHLRYSDHTDPFYWSPKKYALGFVGLEGEWTDRYWTVSATLQGGFKLSGEASSAWLAALSAKRWLNDDWAIGFSAFAQSGTRTSAYRAHGLNVALEKLW